jgi:hypothetical protein
MCTSDLCPCPESSKAAFKANATEAYITKYQRSWTSGGGTPDRSKADQVIKMEFKSSGTTYASYQDCYKNVVNKTSSNAKMGNKYLKTAKKEFG